MKDIPGYYEADDKTLLYVTFVETGEHASKQVTWLNQPVNNELQRTILDLGLPVDYIMNIIENRSPKTYAVMFDLDLLRPHLRKLGYIP